MRYVSTRGQAPTLDFADAVLAGLATDGGLYVPESWPVLSAEEIRALAGLDYAEIACRVTRPFVGEAIDDAAYRAIVERACRAFHHDAVAPLRQLAPDLWLLELFHGPTLAFKDYAMQLLGGLFNHLLRQRGRRVTIVGATSGDTGSAAIEACRGSEAVDIFILYPEGRVSEVQRRQMTTVPDANVHALAIGGTFDDCQAMLKAMFADVAFREATSLSGVNSINWGRILGQIVYYFAAGAALGAPDRPLRFAVPTGNFGNIFAGYVARQMGLPVDRLILATNANDILSRFLATAIMQRGTVHPSLSPSMDIQVASNFERFLFALTGGDGATTARLMAGFQETGRLELDDRAMAETRAVFEGARLDDAETLREITYSHRHTGELLDPHSAIGVGAARAHPARGVATVALATAHPAKFPDAVRQATGIVPPLPSAMADLYSKKERMTPLPNDVEVVKAHIRAALKERGAA